MNANTPITKLGQRKSVFAKTTQPLIIAGPCSAESEEQMLKTAHGLKKLQGVSIFRAGIWKPRTRLGSFQGVGTIGLEWLKTVKQETGLLTACEVANSNHVGEALRHGVDVLILGAHTTVNAFLVQEIAESLRGVDIPVLVKNPVNPDLPLWIGAIERLHHNGIRDMGAIHRGFSTLDNAPYRNHPKWDHVMELKAKLPELPVFCDSSHIAGKRSLLRPVSQRALDLGYDGLVIEAHYNPAKALSDPQHQLMPQELDMLLQTLNKDGVDTEAARKGVQLEELRKQIEHLDDELLELLARRTKVSAKIGNYRKAGVADTPQVVQWDKVLDDLLQKADSAGVDKVFVQNLFHEVRKHYAQTYLYKA